MATIEEVNKLATELRCKSWAKSLEYKKPAKCKEFKLPISKRK